MTEEEKLAASAHHIARQKSLELLFDYTKFHIGVYLTLTGSFLTAAFAVVNNVRVLNLEPHFVWPAVVAFMIAGLAGGVIVSSITQKVGISSIEFLELRIGPWDWAHIHFKARYWTYIEHTSFWIGLCLAVLSFIR